MLWTRVGERGDDVMPEEFEDRDLRDAVFWGVDLTGATFRDVNLTDVTISHARVVHVDIDAEVQHLTVNGVDVTAYVNAHDPWYPLRSMLRPDEVAGMRETWDALQSTWAVTLERARRLPDAALLESVAGEWSFRDTLRHLVFAMDKWFTVPIIGAAFHPFGLPNTGSLDLPWPGLDYDLRPTLAEALAVRADRSMRLRGFLESVQEADFARPIDVLENGVNPLRECLCTVFEEEFWHNRYARRDLSLVGLRAS
jgi:hypothetical protein